MDFLNKLYTKAIFSEAPELNVTAYDLGEDMISAAVNEPVVNRIATATGTVGSLAIIVPVDITISILKTRPVFSAFLARILANGYLGGTVTIYDDVNTAYTIKDVSLTISEVPSGNGTVAAVSFTIQGNLEVNKAALAGVS